MGPYVLNLGVQRRFGNLAFFDIHHQPTIGTNVTDVKSLLEFIPLTSNHYAVAIAIRLRTGNHRGYRCLGKSSHSFKDGSDLLVLDFKLCRIRDMLILAAPTDPEVRTRGL